MRRLRFLPSLAIALGLSIVGCDKSGDQPITGPQLARGGDAGTNIAASVTGHWDRDVPAGPNEGRQQKVSFSAGLLADGTPTGSIKWMFHFPGSPPLVSNVEEVVCMAVLGSTAWIGTVTTGPPGNPGIGVERVWVVVDEPKGFPDFINFGFIPAANCSLLPFFGLLPLTHGEIKVHQPGQNSFTLSEVIPIDFPVFVDCALDGAGEIVQLSGDLHSLFHFTENESGGFQVTSQVNPQNVTGIGQTSGDVYQGTGNGMFSFNVNGLPFNQTFVDNFRIIGPGPGNNLEIHNNFHVTVNANGDLTAFVDNFSAECR